MNVIARKELTMKDGRRVAPGQPVPEFNEWPELVQRSHLNLGWVEIVATREPVKPVEAPPTEEPSADKIACSFCGKNDLKTTRGLQAHIAAKHANQ